ncbi:unnamed protein product [Coregonus sp. 'balchen']|nr:unnamed protein product [Coregonus sp. 'balchen']
MASYNAMSEDQFPCSICLSVFTDPATIRSGDRGSADKSPSRGKGEAEGHSERGRTFLLFIQHCKDAAESEIRCVNVFHLALVSKVGLICDRYNTEAHRMVDEMQSTTFRRSRALEDDRTALTSRDGVRGPCSINIPPDLLGNLLKTLMKDMAKMDYLSTNCNAVPGLYSQCQMYNYYYIYFKLGVGVYFDGRERRVSFYDVNLGHHLYTYDHVPANQRLFPVFSPGDNHIMIVTPLTDTNHLCGR